MSGKAAAATKEAAGPRGTAALLRVTYYTDPLCCWSWALEPHWLRLRRACVGRLGWRLRMGGMIRRWGEYGDPLNAIHKPGQMGPLWLDAARETGMPMDGKVWIEDPPDSSWPACLAFKAAELQSVRFGALFLRGMREALFVEGRNIARREVLTGIAADCAAVSTFDAEQWARDMDGAQARRAFQEDMAAARILGIGRFPTLVVSRTGGGEKILTGWRPYGALAAEISDLVPELEETLR